VATPLAGVIGVVIAFLVVRRTFAGKQTLDFISNLGGAVPGTILGIGYIVAFIGAPWYAVLLVYAVLAGYLASRVTSRGWVALILVLAATVGGYYLNWLPLLLGLDEAGWRYLLMAGFALLALAGSAFATPRHRRRVFLTLRRNGVGAACLQPQPLHHGADGALGAHFAGR
jgi:hypothetical protein